MDDGGLVLVVERSVEEVEAHHAKEQPLEEVE